MTTTRDQFVAAAVIAASADLVTKVLAVFALSDKTVDLRWVELRNVHSAGDSFGLATEAPPWVLVMLTSVAVIGLAVAVWRGAVEPGIFLPV